MRLLDILEPEEFVGSHWHRLSRGRTSLPRHPAEAVAFDEIAGALPIFFRGLGGAVSLRFAAATETVSGHRLPLGMRLVMGEEKIALAHRDDSMILLPAQIDAFADRRLNRKLFFWLAAFFIHMPSGNPCVSDPLARDLDFLQRAWRATRAVLAAVPGLQSAWREIAAGLLAQRPQRPDRETESAVEEAILKLLGKEGTGGPFWPIVTGEAACALTAPRGYRTFLPVVAWGHAQGDSLNALLPPDEDAESGPQAAAAADSKMRKARRTEADQTDRKDYLALNRFEKMLSLIESMNINRAVEDDDEEGARKALEDADELCLSSHSRKAATRLKAELDIETPSAALAHFEEANYPEWDWRQKRLVPDCVHVRAAVSEAELDPPPNERRANRIAQVRRRFEAFRPKAELLRAQLDGSDLDMEAVVRSQVELLSRGEAPERIYVQTRRRLRDMSVAVLADASLSTESWIAGCRVLDIEQEALVTLSHALTACGDEHALMAFSSRKRQLVQVSTLKEFDEPLSRRVERRIFGLKPGYYTRLGAAIRHAAKRLEARPHEHRLLIVLTDGKPNDTDHYEGRFAVEDSRHAVHEARRSGLSVFGITVDEKAQTYFPTLFGRGAYSIVHDPHQLPQACLSIYRNLVLR